MPTSFTTSFGLGDVIQSAHVTQYADPVNRIEMGQAFFAVDSGSTDAYAVTMTPTPAAYTAGMLVSFQANTANTGPATLNVNSLGAKAIKKNTGMDLDTGDIAADQIVTVIYDGTNFQVQSAAGSATALDQLTDVDAPTPADGDVLSYNGTNNLWMPRPSGALDDLADVDAPTPSAGQVLTYSVSSGNWEAAAPAPQPLNLPDVPPGSADPSDDEFDGASLDTAGTRTSGAFPWAWNNQGSATATQMGGQLHLEIPSGGTGVIRNVEQVAPTAPWRFRMKMLQGLLTESNYQHMGMVVRNSSTGKLVTFCQSYSSGFKLENHRWNSPSSYNATNFSTAGSGHIPLYLEIESDGTTLTFRRSVSGFDNTFVTYGTETISSFLGSVDRIGIFAIVDNPGSILVDWFRRMA